MHTVATMFFLCTFRAEKYHNRVEEDNEIFAVSSPMKLINGDLLLTGIT